MKFLLAVMIVCGCFIASMALHSCNVEEAQEAKEKQDWLQFSQQHHCKITREETFWNATRVWQCDGFQVER